MFFGVKKNKKINFKKVVQEEICRWTHAQGQIQIKHQERECPQPGSADSQGRASGILGCYVRISEFSTLTLKLLGPKLEHVDDILGARNVTTSQAYMGVMFTIMRLPSKGPPRCSQVKRKKNDGDIKLVLSTKSRRQAKLFFELFKTALASLHAQN